VIHFDMNSKELITPGFNKTRNDECVKGNQEKIAKYKEGFLSAKEFNKGKLFTPLEDDFLIEQIINRDPFSTII